MIHFLKYRTYHWGLLSFSSLIPCLLLILPGFLSAQASSINFEKEIIDINGTTDWNMTSLVQDHNGYLWFSSSEGLIKYNGYEPKVYKHIPGDTTSLPIGAGEKLFIDHIGDLWISSLEGVSRFVEECECFIHYRFEVNELSPKGFSTQVAMDFTEDNQNRLWMILHGGGLFRYDRNQDQFVRFLDDPTVPNSLIKDILRVLLADKQGNIWIGTGYGPPEFGGGLIRFNPETGTAKRFLHDPADPSSLIDNRVSALLEDEDGQIWVGTYQCGLHQFNLETESFIRMMPDASSPNKLQAPCKEGLVWGNDPFVQILHQDQKGGYWIGVTGVGLNHFDPATGKTSSYGTREFNDIDGNLWTLLEDQTGSIWLGFLGSMGLYKMDTYAPEFTLYSEMKDMQRSCESQQDPGIFWISTLSNGLHRLNSNTGNVTKYQTNKKDNNGISNNAVQAAFEDNEGTLWVGFGNRRSGGRGDDKPGIARMDRQTGVFKYFDTKDRNTMDASPVVYSIHEDQQGYLWLGSWSAGLYRFDKDKESYKRYLLPGATGSGSIYILSLEKNTLWVNDMTGKILYNYNVEQDKFIPFLEGYEAIDIKEDENGRFWIGTWNQGLLHYNPADGSVTQYTELDGLPSNEEVHFLVDEKGVLWISTERGIAKLDQKTKEISTDGLPRDYFHVSAIKGKDGQLLFGGNKGMYSFFSDQMDGNPFPPQVLLSSVEISGEAFNPRKLREENRSLSYQQNNFSFEYVAIHYGGAAKNKYQYKLEPFDKNWIDAGTQRNARYTNLKPGAYTFQVKAANSDGVWNEDGASLSFVILPPWWQTWWAYLCFVVVGISIIAGFTIRFRNKLKAKQQQLEAKQKQLEANRRFVPKDFLHLLGKESILDLQLGDQVEAKMTVLFADIRSYTTLSETMTPQQNFQFINEFLGRMGPIIQANGGFISQYFGDGIMALFKEDHHLAIKAAIEMQKNIQDLNSERLWNKKQAIRVGMGLNTGQLMLGVIGDQNRYDSSVISDAVNTASRMEGLTKVFGGTVIITEKTLRELQFVGMDEIALSTPNLLYRFLGKIKVKGKNEVLNIYDLFEGEVADIQRQRSETKANFEKAIHFYFDQKFGKAADLLKIITKKYPEDLAATYYFERAIKYAIDGVDKNWSGVEEMVSK